MEKSSDAGVEGPIWTLNPHDFRYPARCVESMLQISSSLEEGGRGKGGKVERGWGEREEGGRGRWQGEGRKGREKLGSRSGRHRNSPETGHKNKQKANQRKGNTYQNTDQTEAEKMRGERERERERDIYIYI